MRRAVFVGLAISGTASIACGGNASGLPSPSPSPSPSSPSTTVPSSVPAPPPASVPGVVATKAPSPDEVFARVKSDVVACYEQGRRALPTMTSGKVTFHMAIDRDGRTTCVVPSDDTGLTQEVEDCMRARLEREKYASSGARRSAALPIVVRSASLSLARMSEQPMIDTIESHGLSEEMYGVVDGLLPELKACTRSIDKSSGLRIVYVGGRIDKDGTVACALASSTSAMPASARDCAEGVLSRARFHPPKRGYGLISIPLELLGR